MCTVYIIFVALNRLILAPGGKKILEPPLPLRDNFWFSVIQPSIFCSPYSHMVYGCAGADPSCLWVRGGVHPELVASHWQDFLSFYHCATLVDAQEIRIS